MTSTTEIKLWGTTAGYASIRDDEKIASFEYERSFLQSGIEISPITMPLKAGIYRFPELPYETFKGLPGLLADCLPDRFGNEIINFWLAQHGRLPDSLNAVERLCCTGRRGMGALEFNPVAPMTKDINSDVNVRELVRLAGSILENRKNIGAVLDNNNKPALRKELAQLISVGTSAGGARAKAVIAWNPATNEIKSGQVKTEKGFQHWIIKFSGVNGNKDKEEPDKNDFGIVEYTYHQLAKQCGIDMQECRLLFDGENHHFMTKRFDRTDDGNKIHMQTLGGLAHFDFNNPRLYSYEQAFGIIKHMGMPHSDIEQMFRRMVFNIVFRNHDDHVKNISFLMGRDGSWRLSPAYDLSFSFNPGGSWTRYHQMSLNGKRSDFIMQDFLDAGRTVGLKQGEARRIVMQITAAASQWKRLSLANALSPERSKQIESCFELKF